MDHTLNSAAIEAGLRNPALTFADAYAKVRALQDAEWSLGKGRTDKEVDAAADRTVAAVKAMLAIPAADAGEAYAKVAAIAAYDAHGIDNLAEALDELGRLINPTPHTPLTGAAAPLPAAFERWKALSLAIEEAGEDDDQGEAPALVAERDGLETFMLHSSAVTTADLLVKQRLALDHMPLPKWVSLALYAGEDAALFERRSELDMDVMLIVDTIRGLLALTTSPSPTPFRLAADNYYAKRDFCHTFPEAETMELAEEAATEAYLAATSVVDATPVSSWAEFGEAFLIATLDGDSYLTDVNHEKLAEDARRLRDHLAALPAVAASPSGFALNRAAVDSAKAALDEYREGTFYPAEIIPGYVPEEIEAKERELDAAYWAALEAALAHPCHSVTDLLDKLKVVAAADAWELTPAQNGLEADLGRITGGQA